MTEHVVTHKEVSLARLKLRAMEVAGEDPPAGLRKLAGSKPGEIVKVRPRSDENQDVIPGMGPHLAEHLDAGAVVFPGEMIPSAFAAAKGKFVRRTERLADQALYGVFEPGTEQYVVYSRPRRIDPTQPQ